MKSFAEKQKATMKRLGIEDKPFPKNIAIIMDGNGRWAKNRGLMRAAGHRQGGQTVEIVAQYCVDIGVESLTIYSFSTENWKRPKQEVDALMYLYTQYLVGIREMLMRNNVRLIHMGDRSSLPDYVLESLDETMEITSQNTGMVLAVALNYSGRSELTDAFKMIAADISKGSISSDEINEQIISQNLYCPNLPDPDLLIRTANEMRISNFLLWQISYSEFYVTDTLWPDFNENDVDKAVIAYCSRQRRFGNVEI